VHFVVVFNLTRFAGDKYDQFALRSHLQSLGLSLRSATEPIDDTSHGQADGGRACRIRPVRQRLSVRPDPGRHEGATGTRPLVFLAPIGYLNAPRAMGKSLMPDPETGADRARCCRGAWRVQHRGSTQPEVPQRSFAESLRLGPSKWRLANARPEPDLR
jgi:hypothetical protein